MPLTSEEITNKIDIFLHQVSQKYLMKAEQSSSIESSVGYTFNVVLVKNFYVYRNYINKVSTYK